MCCAQWGKAGLAALALTLLTAVAGCFTEQSFPAVETRLRRLSPELLTNGSGRPPTRQWLPIAHQHMATLLPPTRRAALTSDQLADADGRVVDVYARMWIRRDGLDDLLGNLPGLEQTAQVASPDGYAADPWPGFEDVEITMADGAILCGRFAPPLKNNLDGSCVVLTHGLFGAMYGHDVRNHIDALRNAGHSVLSLEMRGHGATYAKYPRQAITFGACESTDLLAVARWLKTQKHARRVGLVSFSITGYEALLAAWLDGGGLAEKAFRSTPLLAGIPGPDPEPAYNGGMFLVSPPVDFLQAGDQFDRPYDVFTGPVKHIFQEKAAKRMREQGDVPSHRMWDFAAAEFKRSKLASRYSDFASFQKDLLSLMDLQVNNWAEGRRRLDRVRTPLLVVEAANDPLATAQSVAMLFSGTRNPNCAAIILPQGGHMGFPAVSADYYYSLMLSFLDPNAGPTRADVASARRSGGLAEE